MSSRVGRAHSFRLPGPPAGTKRVLLERLADHFDGAAAEAAAAAGGLAGPAGEDEDEDEGEDEDEDDFDSVGEDESGAAVESSGPSKPRLKRRPGGGGGGGADCCGHTRCS